MCTVSVVIPYYNSEKAIIRALDSVTVQTYRDIEIILVDDGSTDTSHSLVEKYINTHPGHIFTHIHQPNSGPSKARNMGVAKACGEYIGFLDSDDSWHKEKLQIQVEFMEKNKNIVILGCDYNAVLDNTTIPNSKDTGNFIKVGFYRRLFKNYLFTRTVLIRKEVFEEFHGFNEQQRYAEDTLLFLRILRKYDGGKIQKSLASTYKNEYGDSGLSSDLNESEMWELSNFKVLRQENILSDKKIGLLLYIIVCLFSILKYFRRLIIVGSRKRVRE